jgi:transcriptional regulator with XRE-family HTH domain
MTLDIGKTIRDLRKNRRLNIADLAERSSLTTSHVSQIERGVANPSLSSLTKIAEALEVPIARFFHEEPSKFSVVRAHERKKIVYDKSSGFIELLAGGEDHDSIGVYLGYCMDKEMGQAYVPHEGKEFFHVMQGEMDVHLGTDVVNLKQGDSIYFDSSIPHKTVMVTVPMITIIVTTSPASFMQTLGEFLP